MTFHVLSILYESESKFPIRRHAFHSLTIPQSHILVSQERIRLENADL